ncbi:MAG TPA: hypothetical protein VIS07_09525 [Candidatus Binatia bacterium]
MDTLETEQESGRTLDHVLTWLAVLLATAWLAWVQFSFTGLYDLDSYFHVRAAEQLATHGVQKTFPQAVHSTWADAYSDKDFLFHVLLRPFIAGGDFRLGGKWYVVFLDFLVLAAFACALRALGVRFGALWVLLLIAASPYYVTRLSSVRPHILGLAFVTLEVALLAKDRWKTLFVVSALHVLAHSSFLLLPALLAARIVVALVHREGFPLRTTLGVLAGIVVASLAHPYFPNNLTVAEQIVDIVRTVGGSGAAIPPEAFGSELRPASWQSLLAQFPGWAPAIVGLVALFAVRGRAAWDRTLTYLALLGVGALVLALRSRRFVDVLVVAALLLAGALWTRVAGREPLPRLLRARPAVAWPLTVLACGFVAFSLLRVQEVRDNFARQAYGDVYAPAMAALTQLAAPDELVYHVSWMDFAVLYAFRPNGRYVSGLDPIFLYQKDPQLFAKNLALSRGRARDAARIIGEDFGGRWVFVTHQPRDAAFRQLLARSAGVRLLYDDGFAQIWQVGEQPRPLPAPPA